MTWFLRNILYFTTKSKTETHCPLFYFRQRERMVPNIHPRLFIDNTKIKKDVTIKVLDHDDDDDDDDELFCEMVDRRNTSSFVSSRDHYGSFSPLQTLDTP